MPELANLQEQALSQGGRGYQVVKDLYGRTPPAPVQTCGG